MKFAGFEYDPKHDDERLSNQLERVRSLMTDGEWRTLREISSHVGAGEASVSAQLRHLRRPIHGSWSVERRTRGLRKSGLYEYRVFKPEDMDSKYWLEEARRWGRALRRFERTVESVRKKLEKSKKIYKKKRLKELHEGK